MIQHIFRSIKKSFIGVLTRNAGYTITKLQPMTKQDREAWDALHKKWDEKA